MAEYEMQESNLPNEKGERVLYPRIVLSGQLSTRRLLEELASGTTYNVGEAMGLLSAFASHMAYYLGQGYSVKVDELGIFTPSLEFKEGKEPGESGVEATRRNARSLRMGGVNFRPDKQFVALLNRECELVRSRRKSHRSLPKYTPGERLELARQYLDTNPFLTVADYAAITGLGRTLATRELRMWAHQPHSGIGIAGRGSHRVYIRAARPEGENAKTQEDTPLF